MFSLKQTQNANCKNILSNFFSTIETEKLNEFSPFDSPIHEKLYAKRNEDDENEDEWLAPFDAEADLKKRCDPAQKVFSSTAVKRQSIEQIEDEQQWKNMLDDFLSPTLNVEFALTSARLFTTEAEVIHVGMDVATSKCIANIISEQKPNHLSAKVDEISDEMIGFDDENNNQCQREQTKLDRASDQNVEKECLSNEEDIKIVTKNG